MSDHTASGGGDPAHDADATDGTGGADATGSTDETDGAGVDDAIGPETAESGASAADATVASDPGEPRDVVVPDRVYKAVTVFSTLIAVVLVVLGFGFLDAATIESSPLLGFVKAIPVTVVVDSGLLSIVLAGVGIGLIALGAWAYVVATRFRAAEMGNPQADRDPPEDNG